MVDRLSNQISQYKIATGTGELTPNTQATISTGANPVSAAIRVGTTVDATTGGTANFLYVAELGSSSLSIYTFDSTKGTLGRVGAPITIDGGQPSALAARVDRQVRGAISHKSNLSSRPERSAASAVEGPVLEGMVRAVRRSPGLRRDLVDLSCGREDAAEIVSDVGCLAPSV